jgi:TM2 domain-containing membrane protein YozV
MNSKDNSRANRSIRAILGALLAWIVPGAGHAFIGRPGRGIIIFLVIGATFWGGIAMGGVMTVDKQGQKWWFTAEMLTGVHGLVGWQRGSKQLQNLDGKIKAGMAEKGKYLENIIREKHRQLGKCTNEEKQTVKRELNGYYAQLNSLRHNYTEKILAEEKLALVAPVATVARVYAGVAGLLNLMCVFDVIMLALIGTVVTTKKPSNKEDERK